MNNIGLRNYSKNLIRDLPYGKAYINLCPAETNVITVIPLIEEMGINYVFNYLARNENGTMGKGGHVSLFRRIDSNNRVYNADFSVDQYSTGVENKETGLTLSKSPIDRYGLSYTYTLKGKGDSAIKYQDPFRDYPCEIIDSSNKKTTITQRSGSITVTRRNYSSDLTIGNNGFITKIEYKHKSKVLKTVNITKVNEQTLRFEYCSPRGSSVAFEFAFSNDMITASDLSSGTSERYCFENSKIKEIDIVENNCVKKCADILFDEEHNVATIVNPLGEKEYSFFEKRTINGKLYHFNSLVANDKGEMISTHLGDDFAAVYDFGYDSIALNNAVIKNQCVDIDDGDCGLYQNKTELEQSLFETINVCNPLRMDWSFNVRALGSDALTLSCFVKALNSPCEVTAELNESKQTIKVSDNWKLLSVRLDVTTTLESINVKLNSTAGVLITPFNVFKEDFANIYKYNGGDETSQDILASVSSGDGTKYDFRYNDDKELLGFTGPHGVTVRYYYTDHNITRESIIGDCWYLDSYTQYQNDLVSYQYDGLHSVGYEYDNYEAIKTVSDAACIVDVVSRNAYGNVTKLMLKSRNEEESIDATYAYDNKERLTSVTLKNGTVYAFSYDGASRLVSISLNGSCVFKYTYNDKNQIQRQYFGTSSNYYEFTYLEGKNDVSKIMYSGSNLSYEYNYDSNDRLVEISEIRNGVRKIIETYTYDSKGARIKTSNNVKELTKILNNGGNDIRSIDTFNQKTLIQEYDAAGRSKSTSPESILYELSENNGYSLATYIGAYNCGGTNNTYQCFTLGQKIPDRPGHNYDVLSVSSSYRLFYKLGRSWNNGVVKETFAFWFRSPRHRDNACLFKIDGKNSNSGIAIYEKSNHFELKKVNSDGYSTTILSTDASSHYNTEDWNFISLSFNIDPASNLYRCELSVNSRIFSCNVSSVNIPSLISGDVQVRLGYNVKGSVDSSQFCDVFDTCYFTLFAIWDPDVQVADTAMFYKKTKDYLTDNAVIDYSSVDFSITRLVKDINTNYDSFKVFPLDNSVLSLDYDPMNENENDKPYRLDVREGYKADNDRFFNFNKDLKRYAFVADGNKLSFKVNMSQKGTIAASYFFDNNNGKQYLFDATGTGTRLGLYRNQNNRAVVVFNGRTVTNDQAIITNGWHDVAMSFDTVATSQSTSVYVGHTFIVVIDGVTYDFKFLEKNPVYLNEVLLGRCFDTDYDNGHPTNRPLFGQIANFAYRNIDSSTSMITNYFANIAGVSKIQMYDDLGILEEEEINKGDNLILGRSIRYSNAGPQVQSEYYRYNGGNTDFHRSYTYDEVGNVTGIEVYGSETKNTWYKYDYRGYLTEESSTDPDWSIAYTYDDNGNILTRTHGPRYEVCGYGFPPPTRPTSDRPVETDTFVYDSQCPDKLIRFNDKQIEYDRACPGNIVSIGTLGHKKTFKYEGRRLVQVVFNELSSIENRIVFEYNDKGLRTSKTCTTYSVRFNQKTFQTTYTKIAESVFKYEYDGNNLVYENSNREGEIFYLYDEAKQLYGFISHGTKYFYIKDFLNNILGVVDENGAIVAKYNYDAYGNLLGEEGYIYNPIRYKGYYYDSELNMFYCQSRYYVPELCRWLNMDNPGYLKFDSLTSMNLFAYCNNNPVMQIDPSGHLAFFVVTLIIGAVIGAAIAYNNAKSNGATGWDLAVSTLIGAAAGAVVGALAGAAVAGATAGSFVATTASVGKGIAEIYFIAKSVGGLSGVGAALMMMADNFNHALGYTPHVFWSGGKVAKEGAAQYASSVDGIVIADTHLGHFLEKIGASNETWALASQMFANQVPAGGLAYFVQTTAGVLDSSIWITVESPILIQKGVEIIVKVLELM